MGHSVRSRFTSIKIKKTAVGALREPTANEDGLISPAMIQHYTNHHPLTPSPLESHQVLNTVLANIMGSVHATETAIHWPSEGEQALSRDFLRVVDDAHELADSSYPCEDEDIVVEFQGAYCRSELPVRSFLVSLRFATSWQSQVGIHEFSGLVGETILVDVDGLKLDSLPLAFSFYIDVMPPDTNADGLEEVLCWEDAQDTVELVSIGRSLMDRLVYRGMEAAVEQFDQDQGWLEERARLVDGVRVWSAGPKGAMRLLLLGQSDLGFIYVGDLAR